MSKGSFDGNDSHRRDSGQPLRKSKTVPAPDAGDKQRRKGSGVHDVGNPRGAASGEGKGGKRGGRKGSEDSSGVGGNNANNEERRNKQRWWADEEPDEYMLGAVGCRNSDRRDSNAGKGHETGEVVFLCLLGSALCSELFFSPSKSTGLTGLYRVRQ
jgi:hypothetical protein